MANPAFKKLEGIQQKIEQLQKEQALAENSVVQSLLVVLRALGAFQWEFEVLVGAWVKAAETIHETAAKEVLLEAGKNFLAKQHASPSRAKPLVAKSPGKS